jgi:hypothetical protein
MMSLVLELQAAALDEKVSIDQLLRKALVVAVKLDLGEFKDWVKLELNGYPGKDLPRYRVLQGDVVCWNPMKGYIPFLVQNQTLSTALSTRYERGAVGVLQQALERGEKQKDYLISRYTPEVVNELLKMQDDPPLVPALKIPRIAFVRILDSVRNTVLEWSLTLESDGILGEGLTFTSGEKDRARVHEDSLRPVVNFIIVGEMTNSVIQQASPGADASLAE